MDQNSEVPEKCDEKALIQVPNCCTRHTVVHVSSFTNGGRMVEVGLSMQ